MKPPVIYLSYFTSYKAYKKTYSLELLVLNTLQQRLLVSSYSPSVNSSFSLYFSKTAHTTTWVMYVDNLRDYLLLTTHHTRSF